MSRFGRLFFFILMGLALLGASAQCIARCVSVDCAGSGRPRVPPCHPKEQLPCPAPQLVAAEPSAITSVAGEIPLSVVLTPAGSVYDTIVLSGLRSPAAIPATLAPSPPLLTILRL